MLLFCWYITHTHLNLKNKKICSKLCKSPLWNTVVKLIKPVNINGMQNSRQEWSKFGHYRNAYFHQTYCLCNQKLDENWQHNCCCHIQVSKCSHKRQKSVKINQGMISCAFLNGWTLCPSASEKFAYNAALFLFGAQKHSFCLFLICWMNAVTFSPTGVHIIKITFPVRWWHTISIVCSIKNRKR